MNTMMKINLKRIKNGMKMRLNAVNKEKYQSSKKTVHKHSHLGVRSVWCGSLQHDGIYTLKHIPKRRN